MQTPYRLTLIPLAVAGILIATAIPTEVGGLGRWSWELSRDDVIQNLLLYLPLGVALWRLSLGRVAVAAGLLSLLIETSQLWGIDRFASVYDIANNTVGAVLGAVICQHLSTRRGISRDLLRVTIPRLLLASLVASVIVLFWISEVRPVNLATWDQGYPLLLGNERTGGRPWRGQLQGVQLYAGDSVPVISAADAIELTGGPPQQLTGVDPGVFVRKAIIANQFRVVARVTTADVNQSGPARLISLSNDTLHRNFDLGQEGGRLVFRLRTQFSGWNGERGRLESRPLLRAGESIHVTASFNGGVSRLYLNGSLVARRNLAAFGCPLAGFCDWGVPLAWSILGGVAALLALAVIPATSVAAILLICIVAAAVPLAAISTQAMWPLLGGPHGLLPLLDLVGGLVVGSARIGAIRKERPPPAA